MVILVPVVLVMSQPVFVTNAYVSMNSCFNCQGKGGGTMKRLVEIEEGSQRGRGGGWGK